MILGRFYFKQTTNGNLTGEFSNYAMSGNTTESADIMTTFTQPFIGEYRSTWFEENAESLILIISSSNGTNNRIYTLRWTNPNNDEPTFLGEGFIVDGILIGDYRDDILNRAIPNLLTR